MSFRGSARNLDKGFGLNKKDSSALPRNDIRENELLIPTDVMQSEAKHLFSAYLNPKILRRFAPLNDTSYFLLVERVKHSKGYSMYYVYMLTNWNNKVLYTGVTNDLERRLSEHRNKTGVGFTSKYKTRKLVYFDCTEDVRAAIEREKQIKGWSRGKKNDLVNTINPEWNDLSADWN